MYCTHDVDQAGKGGAAPVGAPRRPAAERQGRCVPTVAADGPEK